MFKRRQKRTLPARLRQAVWPSMGWKRAYLYYRHRLFRHADSAYKITGGLAIGVSVSFSPFLGTHSLQAIFFGWLFRTNLLASFIGTAFGNPWTLPFIFWGDYAVGAKIMEKIGKGEGLTPLPEHLTWDFLVDHPLSVLVPMTIGGLVLSSVFGALAYVVLYGQVKRMRKTYQSQRMAHLKEKLLRASRNAVSGAGAA